MTEKVNTAHITVFNAAVADKIWLVSFGGLG